MMSPQWTLAQFNELTTGVLYTLLKLRQDVFVVEQECPYPELDDADQDAMHLACWQQGQLMAYARIHTPTDAPPRISRVVVHEDARGRGLGRELMQQALRYTSTAAPNQPVQLSAQTYLLNFYVSLGFVAQGEPYLEDGIPHQHMERPCQQSHW